MTKTKGVLALLLTVTLLLASGCGIVEKKPEAIQKQVVATVGKDSITRGQLDNLFEYVKAQIVAQEGFDANSASGKQTLSDQKKQLLNEMTDEKVLEQKAMELKLFKDEAEIQDGIKNLIDTQYKADKSEEDYNKWMSDNYLTPDILNEIARYQVVGQKVYDYVTKDVTVSDEEAQNYYSMNQLQFTEQPDTMEVSHILVSADDQELAKKIKSELDNGADFKTLSDKYSIDEAAKADGGSLGEITYNDPNYDSTFMAAAMSLKEGEISNPVQTQFGWHIIKVTKKTEYPVRPFDDVKADIKDQLLTQDKNTKYNDTLTEWSTAAGVKTFDENIDNTK